MIMYYDRQGKPIKDITAWDQMLENERRVAETKIWFGLVWVSTVWLGIDHDFTWRGGIEGKPNPHPVIFETMVFAGRLNGIYQQRYSTEAAALAGHARAVKYFRNPRHLAVKIYRAWDLPYRIKRITRKLRKQS